MTNRPFKFIEFSIICFTILFFFSANTSCDQSLSDPPKEIWTGVATGMGEGTLVMNAWQVKKTQNVLTIKGRVEMKIKAVSGGYGSGSCNGTFKGKIKDGVLQAKFSGTAYVSQGDSPVSGELIGTLSENKGSGTYNFATRVGKYTGEWSLEKQ
ncbi:MAG: hypothetical protein KKE44_20045 [Proteobacteria bacterium]|nr:hypothetical protein [Pseudomonadota bacterium]MBU1585024.1 hypothetical protein [Pseudomonadota bacterium]MBU2455302.1 hypothetical protein [Pseudomonadota bacterium]MBU2629029.1 hypothetical protein [Pseudomonadota bacterium]